jgi:tRNA (guanine37-N1)-methyltransferase
VSFRDHEVPEVLRSGDHEKVRAWRAAASAERTRARRPDLLASPKAPGEKP